MSLRDVLMDDARDAQVSLAERLRDDETIELSTASGGTAAPADATYVVMSLNAVLTSERTLAVTAPLTLTDAGAGGNATIALDVAGAVLYDHWEFDGAAWVIVSDPNIADDNFLYFGNNQDVLMTYDEAGDDLFKVTGADWLINGPIVNIGTAVGGGGELLALRVDQDATTAMEIVNANGGNSAAANLRIKNAAGAGANDAMALGVTGTGWNTIGLAVADMGVVQANVNLSGGMLLRVNHATAPLICAVNSDDERWRVDATGMVVNDTHAAVDFRVEGDTQTHLFFVQGSTDNVGVGVAAPAYRLDVAAILTETGNLDDYCGRFMATVDPAANSLAQMHALYGETIASDNVHTLDRAVAIGSRVSVTGDAAIADVRGLSNAVNVGGGSSAAITAAYGELCTVQHSGSGTITTAYGGFYRVRRLGTGDLTNALGLHVSGNISGGAGATSVNVGLNITNMIGGTNNFAIRTNAGDIILNESGDADTDFRFEGDTYTHLLFADGGLQRVGINKSAPAAQLDIDQSDNAAGIPVLRMDQVDVSEQFVHCIISGDTDMRLLTLSVTGTPELGWDESEDQFYFSKGLILQDGDLDISTTKGIVYADSVAVGTVLGGDGTRHVPIVAAGALPIAPVAVGDTLIATAGPLWDILTTPGAAGYVRVSTATTEEWSQTPTMTGDWTWTSAASANPVLTIENTNADAQAPTIDFYKNSASPADNDDLGAIDFFGETSTGAQERYAYILAESLDVTNGDTGGGLKFTVAMDATERSFLELAGYNGAVDEGEIVLNQDGQDVDTRIEAVGVPNAFTVRGSDGLVGIWTDTPDGTLHVQSASAGVVTATGEADDLTVENSAHAGISILSPDLSTARLVFGTPSNSLGAFVIWDYTNSDLNIFADTADITFTTTGNPLILRSTGQADFTEYIRHLNDTDTFWRFQTDQATLDCGGVTMIDAVEAATDYLWLHAGLVGINETANANMTIGLTIDQAANDDEILNFRSSDVGAVLSTVETGTFMNITKSAGAAGGARMNAFKDSGAINAGALQLSAYLEEDVNVDKTTAARALVEIFAFQTDGTDIENTVADGNLVMIRTQRGGSQVTTHWFDEDGDFGYNGALVPYDDLDDAAMARDLQLVLTGRQGVEYNQAAMVEAGILHPSEHGMMVSHKKMTALQLGAIRQGYENRLALEQRVEHLEKELLKWQSQGQ